MSDNQIAQGLDCIPSKSYSEFLVAVRFEIAKRLGWTLEQTISAVGNVIGLQERGFSVEQAADDVMEDMFND